MQSIYRSHKSIPRGVSNRRAALSWIKSNNIKEGVLYFGDDDNTFDLRLFTEIRFTNRVSMFPVGLIGDYSVSSPIVEKVRTCLFVQLLECVSITFGFLFQGQSCCILWFMACEADVASRHGWICCKHQSPDEISERNNAIQSWLWGRRFFEEHRTENWSNWTESKRLHRGVCLAHSNDKDKSASDQSREGSSGKL